MATKNVLKLAIGIPSMGMWHADFCLNLLALIQAFHSHRVTGYDEQELRVIHNRGSILPKQRLEILKSAEDFEATHLLWLDCDHTFPAHLVHKLFQADKKVIGINCTTKSVPANPTGRLKDETIAFGIPTCSYPGKGLEQVWRIGTGLLLVDMKVYAETGHDIFNMIYKPDVDSYQGEDWTMCEAIEKADYEIWVDHDISMDVGHIGNLEYKHDLVPGTHKIMHELGLLD